MHIYTPAARNFKMTLRETAIYGKIEGYTDTRLQSQQTRMNTGFFCNPNVTYFKIIGYKTRLFIGKDGFMGPYLVDRIYSDMMARCGNVNYENYCDFKVCEEWKNDRNSFYEWCFKKLYNCEIDTLELDKDLFSKGEKIYSPDTCCFLPKKINIAITCKCTKSSMLPTGISIYYSGGYIATVQNGSRRVSKTFRNLDDACEFYVSTKERYIREMAGFYKEYLPERIYNALMEYKVKQDFPLERYKHGKCKCV